MENNNQTPEQNDAMQNFVPTVIKMADRDQSHDSDKPAKKKKKKRKPIITLLRIVISLILIAAGIYLILFLVAKAAKYDSIPAMLQRMFVELELMWQRIIY